MEGLLLSKSTALENEEVISWESLRSPTPENGREVMKVV
jgi:hypothetical protein